MTYDALIIGFGPVGATLANLLVRRGLRIGVVETEREIYDKPRAITFDHEAMRVFQACGLADQIAEFTAPHPGTHYLGVDGRVIKKFESLPPPYPLAWPPTSTFVQPEIERLLREGVAGSAAADVFLGHRCVAFTQDDQGVTVTVRDVVQGSERVLRGRTLLGCDGANSFVRKHLNIALEDLGFDEWWMVVDAWIRRPVGSAATRHPVLLAVATGDARPRAGQSAPLGDQAAPRRATGGIWPARKRRPTNRPLRRSSLRGDLALRRLSLSCTPRPTLAARPRLSSRRCMPSNPAVSRPGHVRWHSRRGKPRLEAGHGDPGGRAGRAARHL